MRIKTKMVSSHTADSKPVKQEVNGTVIIPPLVFLGKTARGHFHSLKVIGRTGFFSLLDIMKIGIRQN